MTKRLNRAILTATLASASGLAVSTVWSKPPDLPVQVREQCAEQSTAAPTIFSNNRQRPETNATQVMDAEAFKIHSAQRFYEIGSDCEAKGDIAMARNCYNEATRVCPGSEFAKLASGKLAVIMLADNRDQEVRGGVETEEEPPQLKPDYTPDDQLEPRRLLQSLSMLHLGMQYERTGKVELAHRCYEDAHLVCPTSRYGTKALYYMNQLDAAQSWGRQRGEGGFEEQEPPVGRRLPLSRDELEQRDQAESLFKLAELSLRDGDLRKAYNEFQQSHLVFPDCYFGMKAIERMQEIEKRGDWQPNRKW